MILKMQDVQDHFSIKPFKKEHVPELRSLFLSEPEDTRILNCGFIYDTLQYARLLPPVNRIVAYHAHDKKPIGFVALEEITKKLFSLQFLFVNPKYRNLGVGKRLVEAAISFAKEKNASKINLAIYPSKISTIELYKRYGFRIIGKTSLVQGFLPGFSAFNVSKRVILRRNGLKMEPFKNVFSNSSLDSFAEKQQIFEIFKSCMSQDWINFFEVNHRNLKHGSRNIWLPHFVKALVSKDNNSFALLFNQPYPPIDVVELFIKPDISVRPLFESLLSILSNRGIGLTKLWLFGLTDELPNEWLKKKQMEKYEFLCMGKSLAE